jgi:hypothetical protein
MSLGDIQPDPIGNNVDSSMVGLGRVAVAHHAPAKQRDTHGRSSRPDQIAVFEDRCSNSLSIDIGSVSASHVDEPTLGRVQFDDEMDAGDMPVIFDEPEVGDARTSDNEVLSTVKLITAAGVGTFDNFECYRHWGCSGGTDPVLLLV